MADNYPLARVGDLAESISETHRKNKQYLIFLNTSDILHGKFLHRTYTVVRDWPGQAKKSIQKDDILFSEIRPANGRWAYVDEDADDFVVSTKLMVIRARKDRLFPKFFYQFLTSSAIAAWLQHLAESRSGTFPQITFDQISSLGIPLPSLLEQQAIACILGALDDKIELNRRMNETLEAMARAIFKSWFVDFDPVPGHGPHKEWQDSPLGRIPKGWRAAPIGDVVKVVGGSTPRTSEPSYWGGDIHFATPKDMAALTSPFLFDTERRITKTGLDCISSGLLPVGTVLLSSRAPIGYLAITEIPVAVNQGFIAMVCGGELPNHYVLHWTKQNMDVIVGNANGTTFLEISKSNFRPIQAIIPSSTVLEQFASIVTPLHQQIATNLQQSRTLAAIRDALLPKLLSGEIMVKDAEKFVEARMKGGANE